jgi:hypothetical protein
MGRGGRNADVSLSAATYVRAEHVARHRVMMGNKKDGGGRLWGRPDPTYSALFESCMRRHFPLEVSF